MQREIVNAISISFYAFYSCAINNLVDNKQNKVKICPDIVCVM